MNHPSEPYGQGFSGQQPGYQSFDPLAQYPAYGPQPGFPQQPSYPQPVGYSHPQPAYSGGPQPYGLPPAPNPSPSGVTGIIAGVLAVLGGATNLLCGALFAIGLAAVADELPDAGAGTWALMIALLVLVVVTGAMLVAGAVTLFMRKTIGRWLVVAACVTIIAITLVGLLLRAAAIRDLAGDDYDGAYTTWDATVIVVPVYSAITLLLVLLPATGRWIRAKRQVAASPYYPTYPG